MYVLVNKAMDGLVKIGCTHRLTEDRAKELHTTGVPYQFEIAFRALTSKPEEVERAAHQALDAYRVAQNREFFEVGPRVAIDVISQALIDVAGIESCDALAPVSIDASDRMALTLRAGQVFLLLDFGSRGLNPWAPQVLDIWEAHADGDSLELAGTNDPTAVAGFSTNDPGGDVDPVPYLDRDSDVVNGHIIGRERVLPGQRLVWLDPNPRQRMSEFVVFDVHSYCQVVNRTWNPRFSPEGFPLVFEVLSSDPTPRMTELARLLLRLAPPDQPAEGRRRIEDEEGFGRKPKSSDYWLTQLQRQGRPSRRGKV